MELDPVAKRYADTLYGGEPERLLKDFEVKLAAKKNELASRGLIRSSAADHAAVELGIAYIRSMADARVKSYVDAYERSGATLDDSDVNTIIGEVLSIVYSNLPKIEKELFIAPFKEQAQREAENVVADMRRKLQLHIDGAVLDQRKQHYASESLHHLLESEYVRFEKRLNQIDAKLAAQIREAADRLDIETPESISHCALTCRRALKTFADAIYPARSDQPTGRSLDDSHFVNRLWQFAHERITASGGRELVEYSLESLGRRVEVLNELVSKGVHTHFAHEEAKRCLIQTIFLLAELAEI